MYARYACVVQITALCSQYIGKNLATTGPKDSALNGRKSEGPNNAKPLNTKAQKVARDNIAPIFKNLEFFSVTGPAQ